MNRKETLARFKDVLRAQHGLNPKFCTNCKTKQPRDGGKDIIFNDGKNARWVCGSCCSKGVA